MLGDVSDGDMTIPTLAFSERFISFGWYGVFWIYWDRRPIIKVLDDMLSGRIDYFHQRRDGKLYQLWILNLCLDFVWRNK